LPINGTVYLIAGISDGPGVYTPISAGSWSGSGTYQALGGRWNANQHVFTVAAAQTGTSGQPATIDLSTVQRLSISDPPSGRSLGAAFQGSATSSTLTFTAAAMAGGALSALQQMLGGGSVVPTGWQFTAGGAYSAGNPVYLSMSIGSGYSLGGMQVWHFDGTNWAYYAPIDLNYDGTYANFVVTDLSGYAVVSFDHQTLQSGTLNISSVSGDVMAFGLAPTSPTINLTFTGNATLRGGGTTINANRSMVIVSGVTATIDTEIASYSLTIAGAIGGGGALSKIDPGTLYLTGVNTYSGGTTVSAGTLQTKNVTDSLAIASGAKVVLASSSGTNPHASVINGISGLSIAATPGTPGVLDLTDNGLIITGATTTDETAVAAYIAGGELISSVVAAANSAHPGSMKIVYDFASNFGLTFTSGVATWGGQTITSAAASSDLLILPTLAGDLNLDGAVNFADVSLLAPNLGNASGQTWANGDINGDGAVNFSDVALLAPDLGKTVAAMPPNFEFGPAAVVGAAPEPTSLILLALGGLWTLPRRRVRHVGA
jgi:autotransporter-associated beta strand protein